MQKQKENIQATKSFPLWFGLDVSKDSFTAAGRSILRDKPAMFPAEGKYTLDRKGVEAFLKWAGSKAGVLEYGIAMETTGAYSGRLASLIRKAAPGRHVAVCNAASVSLYARSFTEEKSDKADAALIARYACDRNPPEPRRMSPEETRLREIVRARNAMEEQLLQARNRMEGLEDRAVLKIQKRLVAAIGKAIAGLERELEAAVKASPEIRAEVELMTTAPGVGFLSAACIYAELGSLRQYTRKQVSALSGVCPVNRTSGTSVRRHTMSHHGSRLLRRILFLDSTQAIRKMPSLGRFHGRLLARPDSSRMTAKCACMRKLLLILHAMVVNGARFDPDYKSEKRCKNVAEAT